MKGNTAFEAYRFISQSERMNEPLLKQKSLNKT